MARSRSIKLATLREKLLEQIKKYPDYQIDTYINGAYTSIRWLSVFDCDTRLRVAEVIAVERFSSELRDDSLLVIDYVNSDSHRYIDVEDTLLSIERILIAASERKAEKEIIEANERQC